jgi:acid phosphatase (class A)
MKMVHALLLALPFIAYASIGAFGQVPADHLSSKSVSSHPRVRVVGYLAGREPDFLSMLPPYPVFNSMQDEADVATLRQCQQPDSSPRWKLANDDVAMSYERFSQAVGMEINQVDTPLLIHLLNRAEQDVQSVAFSAKDFYNRPRPYQRFQMEHVCGTEHAPVPEVPLKGGSSYPSGHTSFGWSAVLILAEVAPERAQPLLARGREYGESRIVCEVHYPSDVAAGQVIATAVVERLYSVPEFSRDLACAKQEYRSSVQPDSPVTSECRALEKKLNSKDQRSNNQYAPGNWMRRLGRATNRDISSLKSASSPATIQQNEGHYIAENACQAVAFSAQLVASTAGDTHRLALCFGLCGRAKLAARTGLALPSIS